ncbi:hypothetical protein FOC1_g10014002 [Fusarium oxysporum f. sp. cubense race 1]|uniref:Uncharacterized protein n=1 Tax=Fusarium oxysporum f. sp. cubense (strain race 1) TaxID=1229664 RepID=N4U7E1_FUSC1|nr:hypothetical protein FOC1_g10014002 [Fusarium oxysporum f. sp. cubense race 1]
MSRPCQMNAPEGNFVQKPANLERQAGSWGGERGWARMCRQIQQDKRHMVAPRLTHIVWRCITLRANRMVTLYAETEKASGLGEEVANLDEKLEDECLKYSDTLSHSTPDTSSKPGIRTRQAR